MRTLTIVVAAVVAFSSPSFAEDIDPVAVATEFVTSAKTAFATAESELASVQSEGERAVQAAREERISKVPGMTEKMASFEMSKLAIEIGGIDSQISGLTPISAKQAVQACALNEAVPEKVAEALLKACESDVGTATQHNDAVASTEAKLEALNIEQETLQEAVDFYQGLLAADVAAENAEDVNTAETLVADATAAVNAAQAMFDALIAGQAAIEKLAAAEELVSGSGSTEGCTNAISNFVGNADGSAFITVCGQKSEVIFDTAIGGLSAKAVDNLGLLLTLEVEQLLICTENGACAEVHVADKR